MAESDVILTQLRLQGQRAYVGGMDAATASAKRFDTATVAAGKRARGAGSALEKVGGAALLMTKRMGILAGATGAAAGVIGLKFNARMEQSDVAFTQLLGSGAKAQRMLDKLVKLTTTTPFQLQGVTLAGQQLLGAGVAAKKLVPTLTTIADTVSGVGGGASEMDSVTRAIRQMSGAAHLNREDLNQLADVGVPVFKLLRKQMGLTADQLDDRLRKGTIKSGEGVTAVLASLDSAYKGMAKKQSKTFNGQLSNIGDQVNVVSGKLFKPLFDAVNREALPAISKFGDGVVNVLNNNAITADEKFRRIGDLAKQYLEPLGRKLLASLDKADIPGKMADALDATLPLVAKAFVNAGPKVATAFLKAWLGAGAWTKLLTAGILYSKLRPAFGGAGGRLAGPFMDSFLAGMFGAKLSGKIATAGGKFGKVFGLAVGRAAWPVAAGLAAYELWKWGQKHESKAERGMHERGLLPPTRGPITPAQREARRRASQNRPRHGQMSGFPRAAYVSPIAGPGASWLSPGGILERKPFDIKLTDEIHIHNHIDGREINKVVKTRQRDLKARK